MEKAAVFLSQSLSPLTLIQRLLAARGGGGETSQDTSWIAGEEGRERERVKKGSGCAR